MALIVSCGASQGTKLEEIAQLIPRGAFCSRRPIAMRTSDRRTHFRKDARTHSAERLSGDELVGGASALKLSYGREPWMIRNWRALRSQSGRTRRHRGGASMRRCRAHRGSRRR